MISENNNKILIACECAGTCGYLVVDKWDDENEFWAEFYVVPQKATIRWRLRNAWRSLLGQPTYDPCICVGPDESKRLKEYLVANA